MLTESETDALLSTPWPLPVLPPMDADTYQREAIATAQSEAAQEANEQEFNK